MINVQSLMLATVLATTPAAPANAVPPTLLTPADGATLSLAIPHCQWEGGAAREPGAMGAHDIEIARDERFSAVVDKDRIAAVISRYVPNLELEPGQYWWRVAEVDAAGSRGEWSKASRFSVRLPQQVVAIDNRSSFVEIEQALARAAASGPAVVRFAPGDYRLDPGDAEAFLGFRGASDLVVDGGGATFTFSGFLKFVKLEHCRRVMLKNFNFDFSPLPYTAARVLGIAAAAGTFEAEIVADHPLPESNPHFARDRKGMLVDARYPRMKRGATLVFEHAGWQKLEGRRYRFTAANRRQMGELSVGDIYVLDPRIATGFDVDACDEVVFYRLNAYAVSNEALNSHFGNRLSILQCGLRLKPGRFIAANNGGHNHHSARLGPWIEGCTWENTGDDICHVNCLVMGIEEQLAPNRVWIPLRNPFDAVGSTVALDIQVGDRLEFFNRSEGRLLSERQVTATALHEKSLEVTLDGDVGAIVPGRPGVVRVGTSTGLANANVTQVFNASRSCNQFVFRNNVVRNGRRVGVLAKGRNGLIENNVFEGLGGGAVEFWNAPFEGLGAVDYVVRGNQIRDCGQLLREHAAVWSTIFKPSGSRLHRRLLVADNEIIGFPSPTLLLRDAENVVVRGNRIVAAPALLSTNKDTAATSVVNSVDVRLEDNVIEPAEPDSHR